MNPISSIQLAKELGVTQKTAWFLEHRIREAFDQKGGLLGGTVEVDETYIGGKPRKGNKRDNDPEGGNKSKRGRGTDKTPVIGIVERGGRVRAKVPEPLHRRILLPIQPPEKQRCFRSNLARAMGV